MAMVAEILVDVNQAEEQKLIERAQSGDLDSFSALVLLYQERAIHAANAMIGNIEDAKDLAQEAFVKAYENLDNFKSESRFYTWFYRILTNTCKDFLRKRKFRNAFSFWFGKEEEEDIDPASRVKDPAASASEAMEHKEFGTAVQEAVDKLPFRQKGVFVLRYMEGMPLDEIAESLNITVGAVKANLWQAGQKMKVYLKDFMRDTSVKGGLT